MKPTTTINLITFSLLPLIIGYFIPNTYENLTGTYFPVSINTAIALVILNFALLYWILIFRNRINSGKDINKNPSERKLPPHPLVAARTVALSFAGSRAGIVILGFYLGVTINFLPKLNLNPIWTRVMVTIFIMVLSIILIALSLWLEKICRIKDSDDEPGNSTTFA
jgi:uncharacterized membrane protein